MVVSVSPPATASACAMPKSATTACPAANRKFSGLTSRRATPCRCAWSRASAILRAGRPRRAGSRRAVQRLWQRWRLRHAVAGPSIGTGRPTQRGEGRVAGRWFGLTASGGTPRLRPREHPTIPMAAAPAHPACTPCKPAGCLGLPPSSWRRLWPPSVSKACRCSVITEPGPTRRRPASGSRSCWRASPCAASACASPSRTWGGPRVGGPSSR